MKKSQSSNQFIERHRSFVTMNNARTTPILYRVYKSSVQRQVAEYQSLNSNAGYLILLDDEVQVLGWVGKNIDATDETLLAELGCDIMRREYGQGDSTEIPTVYEISDPTPLLSILLEIFSIPMTSFMSKMAIANRGKPITNEAVSVGTIIPTKSDTGDYTFDAEEVSFAHPDNTGTVARVPFVYVEKTTIAYYQVGNQWDIWFARGVDDDIRQSVITYIENNIFNILYEQGHDRSRIDHDMILQYFLVTYQGQERQCFRRILKIFTDFEPPGRTLPRPIAQKMMIKSTPTLDTADVKESEVSRDLNLLDSKDLGNRKTSVRFNTDEQEKSHASVTARAPTDFWTAKQPSSTDTSTAALSMPNPLNVVENDFIRLHIPANEAEKITETLVELKENLNISIDQRRDLLSEAAINPAILLGWQVRRKTLIV